MENSFARWWVEERGRPPLPGEQPLFEMCQAVWESRQNVEDVDDEDCRTLLRKAWEDAARLSVALDPNAGEWPADRPPSLAAQFQRDYSRGTWSPIHASGWAGTTPSQATGRGPAVNEDVANSTQQLALHVSVIHTPANIDLIANTESRLRTVRDAARVCAEWVQQRILAISGERLCSLVVAGESSVISEEKASHGS